MNKEDWNYLSEENFGEVLDRFKRSLASGRKSYFDVSEFESIVESLLDEGDINTSEIAALQGIQIHPGAVPLQLKYAQVLLSKGKYQNALKYLNLAERIELNNPDIHLMKGSAWLVIGDDKEAEKSFEKAIKYSGSDQDDILYHIGASYVQTGEVEKAVGFFEQSLSINPENELALYDLGFFSDQEGEYQKSIEYYNRYLDIDPFNFSIWFNLGISYNKAGQYENAIEAYEFALALNDEFDQSLFNIANAYANAGKYYEAVKKYDEYLKRDPDNDDAYCYIGECYLNLEDHKKAVKNYQKAIALNPQNDTALFGIGLINWVEKKWNKSISFIKKAIRIDSINSEYWLTLAKVYSDGNRPAEAEKVLLKAAELEADNTDVWLTWVDVFIKWGELDNAIRTLHTGMEKNEDVLLKYRMVGLLLEHKQEKEALNLMLVAMEQDFSQVNYLFEVSPKALKNKKLRRLLNDFREENNF
jgi:tetratricopeptide (TPR) repeat protein